jgi:hypothetical protein
VNQAIKKTYKKPAVTGHTKKRQTCLGPGDRSANVKSEQRSTLNKHYVRQRRTFFNLQIIKKINGLT